VNVIISICLIFIVSIFFYILYKLFIPNYENKYIYLRDFKKGSFLLVYISIIPLYYLGIKYNGETIIKAFLLALEKSISLFALKFDNQVIVNLIEANTFYKITMYICFFIVIVNSIILTMAFIGRNIINRIKCFYIFKFSKETNIIIGYNKDNLHILNTIIGKDKKGILFGDLNSEQKEEIFVARKNYYNFSFNNDLGKIIRKKFGSLYKRNINIIINTEIDSINIMLLKKMSNFINENDINKAIISHDLNFNIYVYGDSQYESIFLKFAEIGKGSIHYINKYRLISMNFVNEYPITKFMDEKYIDYFRATIKDNVNINVLLIGFGKVNKKILETSIANNQMPRLENSTHKEVIINYYLYDKENTRECKNWNHNYNRYKETLPNLLGKEYLPLPPIPSKEEFTLIDICSSEFYSCLQRNLLSISNCKIEEQKNNIGKERINFNYIVISLGKDLENIDVAEKITTKLKEWNMLEETKVFARVKDEKIKNELISSNYIVFGDENKIVYDIKQITGEETEEMAKMYHLAYISSGSNNMNSKEVKEKAHEIWYSKWTQVQRESNIYVQLGIRLKLNLLGYDFVKIYDTGEDCKKNFIEQYQKNLPIKIGKEITNNLYKVNLTFDDLEVKCVRQTLAIQEHMRWNAYMIINGFIPLSIEEIEKLKKGKDFINRKHGCITTFNGLKDYRKLMARIMNASLEDTDVIKYDYQIMDDILWILSTNSYKIIKKL